MTEWAKLHSQLAYEFKNTSLLDAAFTHGSCQNGDEDYQRLEFLGDRVLSLVIADALYKNFAAEKEGQLAARLSLLVRAETCARVGEALGLSEFIRVGTVEKRKGVQSMASVLSDVVEALIGALYLDGGYQTAEAFILHNWQGFLIQSPNDLKDAKTFVQEWALGRALPLPLYEMVSREGPQHAPVFKISLKVGDKEPAIGQGGSKQNAEMNAAKNFITKEELR